jgi:hypothetical protein
MPSLNINWRRGAATCGEWTMGKGRSSEKAYRAVQQKIQAGMDLVTRGRNLGQQSKAEVRASIPPYDESVVKRIPPHVKGKKGKGAKT